MPMSSLLESDPDVHPRQGEGPHIDALTASILDHLNDQTVISLDTLVCLMPQYTWNQILHRVDQLKPGGVPTPIVSEGLVDPRSLALGSP